MKYHQLLKTLILPLAVTITLATDLIWTDTTEHPVAEFPWFAAALLFLLVITVLFFFTALCFSPLQGDLPGEISFLQRNHSFFVPDQYTDGQNSNLASIVLSHP
ncbi:hypothetical protein [Oxalobacter aliiformigenes]|uniref:hypothetical protein n=1 Tax=Oxalobacter aliiformigenes TaxID=2946593 RepID=UPI0022AEC89F|nr:hypothetical protein [Oxalobacter aliiformigenes]WAV92680.1 hypothetical protein NB641_07680 [Oxalobacter aliiformigenes]